MLATIVVVVRLQVRKARGLRGTGPRIAWNALGISKLIVLVERLDEPLNHGSITVGNRARWIEFKNCYNITKVVGRLIVKVLLDPLKVRKAGLEAGNNTFMLIKTGQRVISSSVPTSTNTTESVRVYPVDFDFLAHGFRFVPVNVDHGINDIPINMQNNAALIHIK